MFGIGNKKEDFEKILEDVLNNNTDQIKEKFSILDVNFDKFMAFIEEYLENIVYYFKKEKFSINDNRFQDIEKLLSAELLFKNYKFKHQIVTLLDNIDILEHFYKKENNNNIIKGYLNLAYEDNHMNIKYNKNSEELEIKYNFIKFYNENKIGNELDSFKIKFLTNFIQESLNIPIQDKLAITNSIILLEKNQINFVKDVNLFVDAMKASDLKNLSIYLNSSYKNLMNKVFESYELFEVIKNKNEYKLLPYFFDNHKDLIENKTKLLIDGLKPIYFPEKEYVQLDKIFHNIKYIKDLSQVEKIRDLIKNQLGLNKEDNCPIEDYNLKIETYIKNISKEEFNKMIKRDSLEETIISIFNTREDI